MKIAISSPGDSGLFRSSRIPFQGTRETSVVQDADGRRIDLIHVSSLFRDEGLFVQLPRFLEKHFPGQEPVHLICHGASDGSEPFSVAMALLDRLPRDAAQKYMPIQARDLSDTVLEAPQQGRFSLSEREKYRYHEVGMKSPLTRFFIPTAADAGTRCLVTPELKQAVHFQVGDFVKDVQGTFPPRTVVFFRNAWYLLKDKSETIPRVTQALFQNLQPGSMVIIGTYRGDPEAGQALIRAGFVQSAREGPFSQVFIKPSDASKTRRRFWLF